MRGPTSAAIVRIALAIAVLMSSARLAETWPATAPPLGTSYHPVGIWMLFGQHAPPAALVTMLRVLAVVSTLAMLVGAFTRISTALSFLAFLALASLSFAGEAHWSHSYNPVLLAQCAFLGARGGDVLSVDAYVRGRGIGSYRVSLWLVQFAVALVFASAAFMKLKAGDYSLAWVTSDNMRNQLLARYDAVGLARPGIVDWMIERAWAYRGAAMLSMIAQLAPIVTIFVRHPLVRAVCGSLFLVETIAIGVVMQLWNLQWIPLVAVFIDWDALLRTPAVNHRTPGAAFVFAAVFVLYDAASSFLFDQRFNTYPFTSFPMFAQVRARTPYDIHQPYSMLAGRFDVIGAPPTAGESLDQGYRSIFARRQLHAGMSDALADIRRRYPAAQGVRLWLVVLEVPAYPAPAKVVVRRIGVLCELRVDGNFMLSPLATLSRK